MLHKILEFKSCHSQTFANQERSTMKKMVVMLTASAVDDGVRGGGGGGGDDVDVDDI